MCPVVCMMAIFLCLLGYTFVRHCLGKHYVWLECGFSDTTVMKENKYFSNRNGHFLLKWNLLKNSASRFQRMILVEFPPSLSKLISSIYPLSISHWFFFLCGILTKPFLEAGKMGMAMHTSNPRDQWADIDGFPGLTAQPQKPSQCSRIMRFSTRK